MTTSQLLVAAAAALSLGCASALPASRSDFSALSHHSSTRISLGTLSMAETVSTLPNTLARHGYFIIRTQQLAPDRYQLLTDWRAWPNSAERTRLVIDLRERGGSYALSIQSVSMTEIQGGDWQVAPSRQEILQHLRAIERDFETRSR